MSLIIESYHGLYGVQYIKVIMIHKRSHNPMYDKSSSSTKTHYTNIRKLFILIAPIKTTTRLILYCYVFIQPCLGRFKIIKSTVYIYTYIHIGSNTFHPIVSMEVRKGPFAVFFLSPTPFSQPANSQTPDEAIAVPVVNGFIIFSILHVNIMYKYTLYIYYI